MSTTLVRHAFYAATKEARITFFCHKALLGKIGAQGTPALLRFSRSLSAWGLFSPKAFS
jgi:hypothetical protein